MKRVILSTWHTCAETGARLEKDVLAYQNTETKKVYGLCTETVRAWLTTPEDGSIIPNEESIREE